MRMEFLNVRREICKDIQELQNTLKTEILHIKEELNSLRSEVNLITTRVQALKNVPVPQKQTSNLADSTFNVSEIAEKGRHHRPWSRGGPHIVEDLLRDILPPNSGDIRVIFT
ncbi:uncharacterized protein LOC114880801 isoform X3 [Osmia bicornis bicornis]|uniref:uncharacterized protein LOC114880801 isoform X3 n=1 Tax=Osmia bicornis bicornis TaxID=1437191 RepID=UPI001EAF3F01|nr:uncharacterized protein LOC114880801 isoform X3 [Osmia bicornis bicornis]